MRNANQPEAENSRVANHCKHDHKRCDHNCLHSLNRDASVGRAFLIGVVINATFVVVEFTTGLFANSSSLLADAAHNLGDVAGLILALVAFRFARRRDVPGFAFGYRKAPILAALTNAVLLCVAVGAIVFECFGKLLFPVEIDGRVPMFVAGIGVLINGATALLFVRDRKRDLNVKGAFVHMVADALVSLGVVVSGAIVWATDLKFVDSAVGLIIAFVILLSTIDLVKESLRAALDAVPREIDENALRERLTEIENVERVSDLRVWALGTDENASTARIEIADAARWEETKSLLKRELQRFGINVSTLEPETRRQVVA